MTALLLVLALIVRVVVVAGLAAGAVQKARDPVKFRQAVEGYQVAPRALAKPLAKAIIVTEGVIALWLAIGWEPIGAKVAVAGLLGVFSGAVGINLLRGRRHIDCGCMLLGARKTIGPWLLVRNLILMLLVALLPLTNALDMQTMVSGIGAGSALVALSVAGAALREADTFTRDLRARTA
jgi:hypothetical protein